MSVTCNRTTHSLHSLLFSGPCQACQRRPCGGSPRDTMMVHCILNILQAGNTAKQPDRRTQSFWLPSICNCIISHASETTSFTAKAGGYESSRCHAIHVLQTFKTSCYALHAADSVVNCTAMHGSSNSDLGLQVLKERKTSAHEGKSALLTDAAEHAKSCANQQFLRRMPHPSHPRQTAANNTVPVQTRRRGRRLAAKESVF